MKRYVTLLTLTLISTISIAAAMQEENNTPTTRPKSPPLSTNPKEIPPRSVRSLDSSDGFTLNSVDGLYPSPGDRNFCPYAEKSLLCMVPISARPLLDIIKED